GVSLVAYRSDVYRLRHPVAAGQHHPAAAVGGTGGQRSRIPAGRLPARCGNRRHRRLPGAVDHLLAVQADSRQGGHGLWGFQAARCRRRMARLADAAVDRLALIGGRRRNRARPGRLQGSRPPDSLGIWSLPRHRRSDSPVFWKAADRPLSAGLILSYVVGLTGGIGSGKSAVADAFAALGVEVIDTDMLAHQLSAAGQPGFKAILAAFGKGMLQPSGELDRAALRRLVFADAGARQRLEGLLHPLIGAEVASRVEGWRGPYVIIVVPLLLERTGIRSLVNRILVVDCPEEEQIRRVGIRSRLSPEEIRAI